MTNIKRYLTATALLGAVALTGSMAASSLASAQPQSTSKHGSCFYANDWGNWTAPDQHTMYLRVGVNRIFKLDFASSCHSMTDPGVHLITKFEGSSTVCSPIDIDLKVSDGHGFSEPCIVSGLSELTPAQISAIPKKQLP